MPYVENKGVKLHYHVEGAGPPLVIQHGFSDSLTIWYDTGYVDALKNNYTLILPDARGHGASDNPHDPAAYELSVRVSDVTAVLDDLGVDIAHFMGYSMGGRMGFGIAKYAPERFRSLIIGGMHPYGSSSEDDSVDVRIESLRQGIYAFIAFEESENGPMPLDRKGRLQAFDPEALIGSSIELRDFRGIEDVLPTMTMPCLLFMGEEDSLYPGAKECAKHMPNVTFVSFPGLGHVQTSDRSDLVLPHVTEFLTQVTGAME